MEASSAFPVGIDNDGNRYYGGMTLRDYFAARAMNAYLFDSESGSLYDPDYLDSQGIRLADKIAKRSYQFADAMIIAREP